MKFLSPLALLTLCSVLATPLMADEEAPGLTGCAAKKQGIVNQIELAKVHALGLRPRDEALVLGGNLVRLLPPRRLLNIGAAFRSPSISIDSSSRRFAIAR